MSEIRISIDRLQRFCVDALLQTGMSETDAADSAEVLTTTDAWGIFTHGTKSLAGYLKRLYGGGLNSRSQPVSVREGPAWALVDGQSALAMVTSRMAMQTAIAKAKTQGIAYVGVRNSCHFGAAGYYAWLAAKEGLIGIAMANDIPSVTAPGARGAITGSNPLAYAIPAGKHQPIILDMAISTVAGGKVNAAKALGQPIPDNWIVDRDGRATTDPSQFLNGGALLPMAGHKGYGLALFIETLSGILSGASITWGIRSWMLADASLPTEHGAAFLAIDPQCIAPEGNFRSRVDALIDEIHTAPKSHGSDRIFVPGEREWDNYRRSSNDGIAFPADVSDSLLGAAKLSNLDLFSYLK
jgi:LDH2 family malate/lactate/ureidoglycolate dehydrogenase